MPLKICIVRKSQLITIALSALLVLGLFFFGRTVPKKNTTKIAAVKHGPGDGHNHSNETVSIDTILVLAKKNLDEGQVVRLKTLENRIETEAVKDQQLHVYHQLARFWADSAHIFEPYAWYTAEASRLENSEKSLTFAARLFLENLQEDEVADRRRWKALQAKDLFERSLSINPDNDSTKVGLGACYLFGGISDMPMEGIGKIREVVTKDSTNVYAQMMLAKGSILSGQYDKAATRLELISKLTPADLDANLMLADVYERMGQKQKAAGSYQKSLALAKDKMLKEAIAKRLSELKN